MMTRSSSGQINIAARTRKLDVDNRISLRIYYRIADNVLKQADIFRAEGDVIDLYVMLLRYSSLVSETIPCHRDYRASLQSNKIYLKKKLLNAVAELEELKPIVQQKLEELNRKSTYQVNKGNNHLQNNLVGFPGQYSPANKRSFQAWGTNKIAAPVRQFGSQVPTTRQFLLVKPVDEHIRPLTHGRFRLTNPGGTTVIRQCPRRGFYPHDPPPDGSPIYKHCTDVYMDSNLKFDVIDLR